MLNNDNKLNVRAMIDAPVQLSNETSRFGLLACDRVPGSVVSLSAAAAELVTSVSSPCSSSLMALFVDSVSRELRTVSLRQTNSVTSNTLDASSTVTTHTPTQIRMYYTGCGK